MCIAVCKPIGVEMPSENILRNMFLNNGDGGGFAFNYGGAVKIKKGFMDIESFISAIKECDKKYNFKDKGVLIHTRIATHGGTSPAMCHPFPIVDDEGALKKIEYSSPYAVIHNGIISLTSAEATQKKSLSDTAVFVEKYLTKIATNKNWLKNIANIELIESLIDSKMAVLDATGNIVKTSGFTEDNGVFYSNSSYSDNYQKIMPPYYFDRYWNGEDNYYNSSHWNSYQENKTKDNKKASTAKVKCSTIVPVMRLNRGEDIYFDDGSLECYTEGIELFIDADGEIFGYYNEESESTPKYIRFPLEYYGIGTFLSNSYPIDFVATNFISKKNLGLADDYGEEI